jgi:hypothetical protein
VDAEWKVIERSNPDGPGKAVDATEDGRMVARFVYGEGQIKPYLHVFGESGELLTNPGADKRGDPAGRYPHHRGIFIGWKITSELGTDDLWHMTKGCSMEVVALEKTEGGKDAARIVADIAWRSAKKDTDGNNILLREKRTLVISRPNKGRTQIDASFALSPMRDLRLAGDLQHSGVHFRARDEVNDKQSETSYLMEPSAKVKGDDLKWCRFVFPAGERRYSALQLNHPQNPVEELSTRTYGRFGYFFKKDLKKDEKLALKYRFIVAPASEAKLSPEQADAARKQAQQAYDQFVQAR